MTEPLNILTATQLQWLRDDPDNWAESDKREALATIQAFAELLELSADCYCKEDDMQSAICSICRRKRRLLAHYHGTGSEKEGGGK